METQRILNLISSNIKCTVALTVFELIYEALGFQRVTFVQNDIILSDMIFLFEVMDSPAKLNQIFFLLLIGLVFRW